MEPWLIIVIVVVVLIVLYVIATFNGLVGLNNKAENAWKRIGAVLQKRVDAFGNFAEAVKGYADLESEMTSKWSGARDALSKAQKAPTEANVGQARASFGDALSGMRQTVENYPDLKSQQSFINMQDLIKSTENELEQSRAFYNAIVEKFNTKIQIFPNNIFIGLLGLSERSWWENENQSEQDKGLGTNSPKVSFSKKDSTYEESAGSGAEA
jgi:LemA protein